MRNVLRRSTPLLIAVALIAVAALPAAAGTLFSSDQPGATRCVDDEAVTPAPGEGAAAGELIITANGVDDALFTAGGWCEDCCWECDPRSAKIPCDEWCGCNCDGN